MLIRKFALDFAEKYRTAPIQLDESARSILENYSWPGNIRELKNVVEQISVLVEDRDINGEKLIQYIPSLTSRHLPALANGASEQELQEREILYKLLFDMKGDLNDLKSLVYGLIQNNDLQVPANSTSMRGLRALSPGPDTGVYTAESPRYSEPESPPSHQEEREHHQPIILGTQKQQEIYDDMEEVEENLSLEDHEKELIIKALKKHNGRRKEAAKDLGISERTLYRKIKQYEL